MKKLLIAAALIASVVVVYAAQIESLSIRQVRDPVQLKSYLESNASDAETRIAALEVSVAAQVDTNDTTTVTAYEPAYVGQLLVGYDGPGTNAVWVAGGETTNDWLRITLE